MKFEESEYDSAESYFDEALSLKSDLTEANAGKGWSKLMKDESSFTEIANLLELAKLDTSIQIDVFAGLAIVNDLLKQYSFAIDYVNQILSKSPSYVFQHNPTINYQDLLVIQSHSYLFNKQFDKAYETISLLTTEFIFDPDDSSTWIVEGDRYPSYEGAISAALAIAAERYKSF